MSQTLTQRIGDTKTHTIPLSWSGRPFVPGGEWHLVFTVKSDPNTQTDEQAELQLESGSGITANGSLAMVAMIGSHTSDLVPGTYYWDIQAEELDSNVTRTVASGTLVLLRDVTRSRRSSVGGVSPYAYRDPSGALYLDPEGQAYTQTI